MGSFSMFRAAPYISFWDLPDIGYTTDGPTGVEICLGGRGWGVFWLQSVAVWNRNGVHNTRKLLTLSVGP